MLILFAVLVIAVAVGLISLVFRLLRAPIRLIFKLLIHIGAGFVGLFIVNLLGSLVGFSLGVNWINALVVGVLGVPGVVLLVLLTLLL